MHPGQDKPVRGGKADRVHMPRKVGTFDLAGAGALPGWARRRPAAVPAGALPGWERLTLVAVPGRLLGALADAFGALEATRGAVPFCGRTLGGGGVEFFFFSSFVERAC